MHGVVSRRARLHFGFDAITVQVHSNNIAFAPARSQRSME